MKSKIFKILLIVLPISFYIFFSIYDGVVWCVDSPGYVTMWVTREPVYPLFLYLLRTIFNNNEFYLNVAVLIQGLLMAWAIFSLTLYLGKEFKLNNLIQLLIEIIFLFVSLLCKYAAQRGSMYSNSLLSESLSYPLYILFFRYLLEYLFTDNKKPLIISSFISFVLISTRKQMYLSLFLIIIVLVYKAIYTKMLKRYLIIFMLVCMSVIGTNKLFDYSYNLLFRGLNATHTSSDRFLATVVFYNSSRDNADLINDKDTREVFLKVYDACNDKKLLKNVVYSDKWYDRAIHFCDTYDYIQLHNMWPIEKEFVFTNNIGINDNEAEILVDNYNKSIIKSLIPKIWPEMIKTFFDFFLLGLMTTVSAISSKFMLYSFIIIGLYVLLLMYTIIRTKLSKYSLLGIIILLTVLLNDCIVSAVIFPQTRYTIYNMGLFYAGGLIMLWNIITLSTRE